MLKYPEGYYVSENGDHHTFKEGSIYALCRPDSTKVWSFDSMAVLECEVILAAFGDHSDQLSMEAQEAACCS
jgi:hypothetical protein